MVAGFGGVHKYVGYFIRFSIRLGGGFMKNVAVTFFVPKSIHDWPLIPLLLMTNQDFITFILEV